MHDQPFVGFGRTAQDAAECVFSMFRASAAPDEPQNIQEF